MVPLQTVTCCQLESAKRSAAQECGPERIEPAQRRVSGRQIVWRPRLPGVITPNVRSLHQPRQKTELLQGRELVRRVGQYSSTERGEQGKRCQGEKRELV